MISISRMVGVWYGRETHTHSLFNKYIMFNWIFDTIFFKASDTLYTHAQVLRLYLSAIYLRVLPVCVCVSCLPFTKWPLVVSAGQLNFIGMYSFILQKLIRTHFERERSSCKAVRVKSNYVQSSLLRGEAAV